MSTPTSSAYEIIKAKDHPLGRWFWDQFVNWSFRFNFEDLVIIGEPSLNANASTFLISNHVSWWDGFWAIKINKLLWGKSYYVMMLEEQLKARQFLRYAGAYSVRVGHRSVMQSLNHSVELLQNPENLVQIFPQGRIYSTYQNPAETPFSSGVGHILKKLTSPVDVVLSAALVDYFSTAKPILYYYLERYDLAGNQSIEEAYADFYQRCLDQQVQRGE